MKCPYCGEETSDKRQFCDFCSGDLTVGVPTQATEQTYVPMPNYPMKWYKFLIYFLLFACAIINAFSAISPLLGLQYNGAAAEVYTLFPAMRAADISYGILGLAFAVYQVYTRFLLSGYAKQGPLFLKLSYVIDAGISTFYTVASILIIGITGADQTDLITSCIGSILGAVVMIVLNHIYFKKRAHLFVH